MGGDQLRDLLGAIGPVTARVCFLAAVIPTLIFAHVSQS